MKVMRQILPFTVVNKLFKILLKFKSNRVKEHVNEELELRMTLWVDRSFYKL